jgi:beta-glucanase (GH16 family)
MSLSSFEIHAMDFNQVIFFDDFNGMSFEDDPNCFTKLPICSKRAEWGDSGECRKLTPKILEQLSQLNKCKWKVWESYSVFGSSNAYLFHPSQVQVANGLLTITAKPTNNGAKIGDASCIWSDDPKCAFISGGLDTRPSFGGEHSGFDFRYGKIEFKARMTMGPGSFPALWMFDSRVTPWERRIPTDPDRRYQEIDVLEIFPDIPVIYRDYGDWAQRKVSSIYSYAYQTLHWGVDGTNKDFINNHQKIDHTKFHIFSVEWSPDLLVFKIDNIETHRITTKDKKNKRMAKIPDHEMYLIMDFQLSKGNKIFSGTKYKWLNDLADLKSEVKMEIDWVKVSSQRSQNNPLIKFPHPPLITGLNYKVEIRGTSPYLYYNSPCIFGGTENGSKCDVLKLTSSPLPSSIPYLIKPEFVDGGPGIFYVNPGHATSYCPYGGSLIKKFESVSNQVGLQKVSSSLLSGLCRLHHMPPTTPSLFPGVNYAILAPEVKRGFGIYYPQAKTQPVCPFGGRSLDLHDYYGDDDWISSCQVMELDRSKIDPLRSIEILMHQDPAQRIIRYRNDF